MTEQHLKILSRLTPDVRLAYDGDDAGIRATERAINLAGNLGINLSVISDYHGAKDPDELIQKGAELWQEAVKNYKPAVDWLLDKYEEKLDLLSAQGKKEYSDVALRVISYLNDPVVKKHYEQKVAEKLEVSVEDLKSKKIDTGPKRRLKKVKTTVKKGTVLETLESDLMAIKIFGGEAGAKINLPLPEDETKIEELSLVYENKFSKESQAELARDAEAMMERYERGMKKLKVRELSAELEAAEDDEEKQRKLLREIQELQRA